MGAKNANIVVNERGEKVAVVISIEEYEKNPRRAGGIWKTFARVMRRKP